jgi:hypothetical protein
MVMVQELLFAIRVSDAHVLFAVSLGIEGRDGGKGEVYPGAGFPFIRPA